MMQLLAHRGFWKNPEEKNARHTMTAAFQHGWGVETDLRDFHGDLVISHEMATQDSYSLRSLLKEYRNLNSSTCLALNIKADGLSDLLHQHLQKEQIPHYFVFDMSVPETLRYLRLGMNVFTRMSEYEKPDEFLFEKSQGIWLDAFTGIWYDPEVVNGLISNNKKVAIVSSELHGRPHEDHWFYIRENNWHLSEQVYLCTDLPDEAVPFFN